MKIVKNLSEISEIVSDLYKSQKKINLIPPATPENILNSIYK